MMKRFYFNMIEIILAISIIAIGISSVMVLFTSGLKSGNDAVQLDSVPDATESILTHVRQTASAYGLENGWSAQPFQALNASGWEEKSSVTISAFGNNLDTDGRAIVAVNSGSDLLYRQLVVSAVNSSGTPTHYSHTFSAIAEVRRISSPPSIMLSHPHTPSGAELAAGAGGVSLQDSENQNAQTQSLLVLEVRISYPAEAAPEARTSKIHRVEIFNDKYDRFVP